jgi:thiol-disulfide isomerase/thioredoxin
MVVSDHADQQGVGSGAHSAGTNDSKGERIWKVLAVAATLLLVGFITYAATRPHAPRPVAFPVTPPAALATGSEAPTFVLPRLGGGQVVALASSRGTPTVVNFFASWCNNCQAEISSFAAFSARSAGHVAVIGVDSNDSDTTAAERMLVDARATYPVGVDSGAKVATAFLLNALPVTYFLDAGGRVVHVAFGEQTLTSLNHWAAILVRQ